MPGKQFYPKGTTKNKKKINRVKIANPRMKAFWADPIRSAAQRERLAKGMPGAGRKPGHPDGMTEPEFLAMRTLALQKKEKVMAHMGKSTEFEPDNKIANQAIEVAVEILLLEGAYALKLQAAKTLLEYTQRKPVVANETTLKNAESFLDEIVNEPDTAETPNS